MKRTWGYVALAAGGTPQPVFGTTLTNAVAANPTLGASSFNIVVGATAGFASGDKIILDAAGASPQRLQLQSVVSSTVLQVKTLDNGGILTSHAANTYVQLAVACTSFFVQCKEGNAAKIYIGNSSAMVKATGVGVLAVLEFTGSGTQPYFFADPMYGSDNGMTSDTYWFDGTTSDSILPSLTVL